MTNPNWSLPRNPASRMPSGLTLLIRKISPSILLRCLLPRPVSNQKQGPLSSHFSTLVDQLPPPHLASLQCSFRYLDQSFSELSERIEDSQQSHSDTLKETTAAQALCQEANLVTLERTNNTDSLKIRDEVSHVKVIGQNIQRNINELTASLHPSSRILHQLQAVATGLADQQTTFTKNMEYYMYKIGIKFDSHPHLQGSVQKTTGATPPVPPPPSMDDRQKIIQLEADILKKDQELRLKICANTALETAVSDLEEDLCNARSRTEALHSDLSTLRQANLDLRKVQSDSLQTMSRPADHPAHLSKVQANVQAGQARQMSAFLQREAARLIGENKHTYELAKRGFQEEVSRLREDIRDLKTKMSSHIPDEPDAGKHSFVHDPWVHSVRLHRQSKQQCDWPGGDGGIDSDNQILIHCQ